MEWGLDLGLQPKSVRLTRKVPPRITIPLSKAFSLRCPKLESSASVRSSRAFRRRETTQAQNLEKNCGRPSNLGTSRPRRRYPCVRPEIGKKKAMLAFCKKAQASTKKCTRLPWSKLNLNRRKSRDSNSLCWRLGRVFQKALHPHCSKKRVPQYSSSTTLRFIRNRISLR